MEAFLVSVANEEMFENGDRGWRKELVSCPIYFDTLSLNYFDCKQWKKVFVKMLKPLRSFHSQYNNHSDHFQKLLENPLAHVSPQAAQA